MHAAAARAWRHPNGGAIPETALYAVSPSLKELSSARFDEDFAVESMAGDMFFLGLIWRIRRVEAGRVRVEDAHGAPPTIPFWLGEAPHRTSVLLRTRRR